MEHWPEQAAEAETQLKQDVHHNVSDSNDRLVMELETTYRRFDAFLVSLDGRLRDECGTRLFALDEKPGPFGQLRSCPLHTG